MKKVLILSLLTILSTSALAYYSNGFAFWSRPGHNLSRDQINDFAGCYARFHMDKTHDFRVLNVMGRASFPDIDHVLGLDIERDINFIEVGPRAVVRLYDNEGFRDYRGSLEPSSTYEGEERLDMIDSFEVTCL